MERGSGQKRRLLLGRDLHLSCEDDEEGKDEFGSPVRGPRLLPSTPGRDRGVPVAARTPRDYVVRGGEKDGTFILLNPWGKKGRLFRPLPPVRQRKRVPGAEKGFPRPPPPPPPPPPFPPPPPHPPPLSLLPSPRTSRKKRTRLCQRRPARPRQTTRGRRQQASPQPPVFPFPSRPRCSPSAFPCR